MSKNEKKIDKKFVKSVIKEIDYIKGPEFAKRLIIKTDSGRYWTKDGFKSSSFQAALDHNGVKGDDAIIVNGDSSWGYTHFNKWLFEPNGEYIAVLEFIISNKPSGSYYLSRLSVRLERIIRLNKNATFYSVSAERSRYCTENSYDGRIEEFLSTDTEDLTCQCIDRRKIFSYCRCASDLNMGIITATAGNDKYRKYITTETWAKASEWFIKNGASEKVVEENYGTNGNKIYANSIWCCFKEMKKGTTKSSNARKKLLLDVFTPIADSINRWAADKTAVKSTALIDFARDFITDKNNRYYDYDRVMKPYYNKFVVRHNEWLIYCDGLDSMNIIFYNIEKDKKYHVSMPYRWRRGDDACKLDLRSICVFNIERTKLTSMDIPYNSFYDGTKTHIGYYDDIVWCDTLKMYDILGNELTFEECFDGAKSLTSSYEYIKNNVWFPSRKNINILNNDPYSIYHFGSEVAEYYDMAKHTIEELNKQHRVPTLFISMILLKDKYKIAAEQLLKSKLFELFRVLTTDQNSFVEDPSKANRWKAVIKFDDSKTNLKDCFAMNISVLRAVDEIIRDSADGKRNEIIKALSYPAMILGDERARSLNVDMYKHFVSFCVDHHIDSYTIGRINDDVKQILSKYYNNPNTLLNIFEKISNIDIWCDYIRMREQMKDIVKKLNISFNFKSYKDIPDKSTRFVTLRPKRNEYAWNDANMWINEKQQFDNLKSTYKNVTPIYGDVDKDKIVAVVLEMDTADHIRYLHDELSFWLQYYRNKEKDSLFGIAAERVKKYEWSDDLITIVAPKVANDVQHDAGVLNHCAASFIDPIINGTENIMFIRRKDMPEVPWFTMAIDNNGNIEQIHLFRNGDLSEEDQEKAYRNSGIPSYSTSIDVMKSLKKWAKEKGVNPNTLRMQYGALCARR